ncbi:MAG TPA: 30S ribosomal protein S1 [Nitrospirota bacterium]|nr:30S ribosomal protein S1 [Nitrospirota bacterium]
MRREQSFMKGHEDIQEEHESPGEEESSEFAKLFDQSVRTYTSGSVVKGKVLQVVPSAVMIDLGYKSDGVIPAEQFTPDELKELKPGDELEVFIESGEDAGGSLLLSREKARKIQVWDVLNEAYQTGSPVKGRITGKTKGGLLVDIGVPAFLPGSQIDLKPVHSMDPLIGQTLEMKIVKMNSGRGNIVLSRRELLEQQQTRRKAEVLSGIVEGQPVTGVVKNITDYGVFVDLGGIDGLLHVADMSWGRIGHPSELFKQGDTVEAVVLKYDREKQKISLGTKQKTEDPWRMVAERYPVGSRVRGKVVSLQEYGAFVELEHGVEGLLHVSEMSWTQKVKHPSKLISVGEQIEVQVLTLDATGKRVSLGMKQVAPNPWDTLAERYPVGSTIEGKVRTITDFGAFMSVEEGIDGLIHISDLSWMRHIKHPSEVLKKGQTTKAVVLSIDPRKERISLGLKQLTPDPWLQAIPDRYKVGQDETARVLKTTEFGVFVELEQGVEGLVPASELLKDAPPLKEGEEITARIIKVDRGDRKIALSIKAYERGKDKTALQEFMRQQEKPDTTLGALLKERR